MSNEKEKLISLLTNPEDGSLIPFERLCYNADTTITEAAQWYEDDERFRKAKDLYDTHLKAQLWESLMELAKTNSTAVVSAIKMMDGIGLAKIKTKDRNTEKLDELVALMSGKITKEEIKGIEGVVIGTVEKPVAPAPAAPVVPAEPKRRGRPPKVKAIEI